MKKIRTLKPIKYRIVSPEELVSLVETRRNKIESTRFVPPKVGENSFGRFRVEFKDFELIDG
ncbi:MULTISPECIES: hypothetical protein [Methylomonas]|uniref:hypothetical protein n=1 Tax=Methylomonas TaxID=416 RepID=UPI001231CFE5|nr:hypothetical protein [Methylomonas rhizoryzae]